MAHIICQICGKPLGDRPADAAPGPKGALWYVHRDAADCAKTIARGGRKPHAER